MPGEEDVFEELELEDDEQEEQGDGVDLGFLESGQEPVQKPAEPVKVEASLDADKLGSALAGAIKGQGDSTIAAIRDVAREVIGALPKSDAPKKTKEEIASENALFLAQLQTGEVSMADAVRTFVQPSIDSTIERRVANEAPQTDAVFAGNGEQFLESFKARVRASVNPKLWDRYEKEIDALAPESLYGAIGKATAAQRKTYFSELEERVEGRIYKAARSEKTPRAATTGGSSAAGGDRLAEALRALPKDERDEAIRMAEAFAKARGLRPGTKEFDKLKAERVADYIGVEA